jgi:hypothetical protein
MTLTGTHLVRTLRSALQSAKHFWPRVGDRMEVRRHALKLRHWGSREAQGVMDLTYESIKAMAGSGVYELRIDDEIGGKRNIRVLFFEAPEAWKPNHVYPKPVLWVLETLPKKRQDWTANDIDRFWAKRTLVKERFYDPATTRGVK